MINTERRSAEGAMRGVVHRFVLAKQLGFASSLGEYIKHEQWWGRKSI